MGHHKSKSNIVCLQHSSIPMGYEQRGSKYFFDIDQKFLYADQSYYDVTL